MNLNWHTIVSSTYIRPRVQSLTVYRDHPSIFCYRSLYLLQSQLISISH